MKKYNVGIIGYSWAAGAHIEAINRTSLAQVTALCSSRKLDSAEISAKQAQFEAFFQAVEQGKEMPLTSLTDALYTHEVLFSADRSAEQNALKNK